MRENIIILTEFLINWECNKVLQNNEALQKEPEAPTN